MGARTSPAWIAVLKRERANDARASASKLARRLASSESPDGTAPPAERTVRDLLVLDDFKPEALEVYRELRWPDSLDMPDLPWEAGRAVVELLAVTHPDRPTVREGIWYWRLRLAAPDAPARDVAVIAEGLAMRDGDDAAHSAEAWLVGRPWSSPEAMAAYLASAPRVVPPPMPDIAIAPLRSLAAVDAEAAAKVHELSRGEHAAPRRGWSTGSPPLG